MLPDTIPQLCMSDMQDLYSMAYVQAIIAAAGFDISKTGLDRNSADLQIEHLQMDGFVPKYGRLLVQVKCTYAHGVETDNTIHYSLPLRNYNHLREDKIEPRILVVVLVPRPELNATEPWTECMVQHTILRYRAYWLSLMGAKSTTNQDSVTVKIPTDKPFNIEAVHLLMDQMVTQGNKEL
ncbi:MAG: DUF4365 domain-containing protein [Chloroflexi bacterium]|nr:DUF4365 domain-containing protein [Chloroflexota bacterium]